ncbi:SirB2 family protein [Neptuniibacter sp.]|uniref:SirB2 family protein n=1 Tax=Neptuniibacter sp. TaxID=1962643 RepID=UPI002618953A|nr:SirB2 family protein [Neptuniibacter sp.]MCP4595112.1 SirB2 family protein [Neptuniibacter sp.]
MSYLAIKHIHLTAVACSLLLFLVRGTWALYYPEELQKRWVKIVPHIIDTILLVSAITLAIKLQQYPFIDHWLTAKVLALCLYIALGTVVIKRGKTKTIKIAAFFGALCTFAYIVSVALSHNPLPGLS